MTTATIGDNTGNSFSGTDDAPIKSYTSFQNTNYGTQITFDVNKYGSGDNTNAVLKFTGLSNISGPVTVTSATIYLYCTNNSSSAGSITLDCFRLLRNWVEAQVTWNNYSTGNAWTTAGGLSSGNDIAASASAQLSISNGVGAQLQYHALTSAQLATDVENIINGSANNYGWLFARNDAGNDGKFHTFASSEGTDATRPYLEVVYTASGGSTKPAYYYAQL